MIKDLQNKITKLRKELDLLEDMLAGFAQNEAKKFAEKLSTETVTSSNFIPRHSENDYTKQVKKYKKK